MGGGPGSEGGHDRRTPEVRPASFLASVCRTRRLSKTGLDLKHRKVNHLPKDILVIIKKEIYI